jgi:hypothetical protein
MFNEFYGTIDFILTTDPFVKGVINKRLYLLKSYDWVTDGTDDSFVKDRINIFHQILYNQIFYGKCLVRIFEHFRKINISIIPPQEYYVLNGEYV